ncbi:hypothetical protein BY996DRAFT_6409046 [Phakopsora pachyrhizi]|nr:hypothetical protein BY996DRAFT_6409046 [Phakopsora pachyrhizi]
MTVVNLQLDLQNSSSSSLPVSLRLPLSPTTRSRLTPKSKSTNTTKPAAIRPHTPDLTSSRPKSPSQINLANLVEAWGGGGPSELSYRLPDPPSPISAFEINLSTQSNDSQSSLNHSLNQDHRCPMYHQPKVQVRSGLGHQVLGQTVDPKPLPNHDLPQRTLTIQALPPSEHPESNRSNTPGQSWPENLPNHQLSSKLEIERKDEDKIWIEDMFRLAIVHLKCLPLIRLARLSNFLTWCPSVYTIQKAGDLTKERDKASAKAQKSGGSKINEMFRIIKEQALKFEEERH